jgi:small subunit ribosomal protein S1
MSESINNNNVDSDDDITMEDFKNAIDTSFKKLKEGDIVTGTVIGISDTEVTLDLGTYAEGIIKLDELSNNPRFSIKADVKTGETLRAVVLREDRNGNILLSCRQAADELSWDELKKDMEEKTVFTVKIDETVNGGVTAFIKGVRGFIPASRLDSVYVEDTAPYVGKFLDVIVFSVDKEHEKLILSSRDVISMRNEEQRSSKISRLSVGDVFTGTVDKIMPFGAFVSLPDGLSGLVHISQISDKRLKSPNEILKEGEKVKVKLIGINNGKISLSIKDAADFKASENDDSSDPETDRLISEFGSVKEASTSLASLLNGIKLDN